MTTVVVGAGLAGLVRARALAARGEDVMIFESSDRAGGVVRSEKVDGYLLELGPNTVRSTPELWGLVHELGLESEALLADPRMPRYIDFGGRLHSLPTSPGAFLRSDLLSTRGKLRVLAEPFTRPGDPRGETVREFFTRRLGKEVADRLVDPFVSGIWAGSSDRLSVEGAFPALAKWEAERGSLTRGALAARRDASREQAARKRGLLSFRAGLEMLPRRLAEDLGSRARFGMAVDSVDRAARGWTLLIAGQKVEVERMCIATPAGEAARLVEGVAPDAAAALSGIPHAPLVVVHLSAPAKERPPGFGHLVVPQSGRRILGAIWSSSLFAGRAPPNRALYTTFLGGARDPGALELADSDVIEIASRDLCAALETPQVFEPVRVTRYPRAIPQYDLDHRGRMEALSRAEKSLPGLSFVGSYRGGISVGDVVRTALAV
ncbi:MAG TPA: protoporphyrinogen oxidase [Thermoanaerobaculia bacterium]